jgi:hypothetical protein
MSPLEIFERWGTDGRNIETCSFIPSFSAGGFGIA